MKQLIAAVAAVAVLAVAVLGLFFPNKIQTIVGAQAGPELYSPYRCVDSFCEYIVAGSCSAATSTLFSVANPTGATSTVTLLQLNMGGNATSTDVTVGTTTKSVGLALTDINVPYFINDAFIATSTVYRLEGGQVNGPAVSFRSAGSGSIASAVVSPSTRIAAFATSTYDAPTAGVGYVGTHSTCNYLLKFEWKK